MPMLRKLAALALVAITAAPAAAVTFVFGGANANVAAIDSSVDGVDLSVTARRFTLAPATLTTLSDTIAQGQISITAPGIGIAGGASGPQIDTNAVNAREALLFAFSQPFALTGLRLSMVDVNDTLMVYGVGADGGLTSLGFDGLIRTGLAGDATFTHNNGLNGGTTVLTFNSPTAFFDSFLFTTRVGGELQFGGDRGQGYRVDSISGNPGLVPEPTTWIMLIAGFGLIGLSMRRRRDQQGLPSEA